MFEQDYLMRMILQLVQAIARSMEKADGDEDPSAAADLLEEAVGTVTELDGSVLLSLAPDSIASILSVSGTDPGVVEYVARTLHLESDYLDRAGRCEKAQLREAQARALASAYGFDLDEELGADAAMRAFLEHEEERASQGEETARSEDENPSSDCDSMG